MKRPPADAANAFATPADGLRTATPVILAYLPLGFAAGVVGAQAGMSPAEVALLSLLVFAGVSQFVFADLLAGAPSSLIVTVGLLNFRHFLYSTALAQKLRGMSAGKRVAIGAQLTDEGFALMSLYYHPRHGAGGLLALNISCYVAWFFGNVAGALAGALARETPAATQWGADYLLIAMFAALLMLGIVSAARRAPALVTAGVAAALGVGLELWRPHPMNMLIAASAAAAAGALIHRAAGGVADGQGDLPEAKESEQ